MNERQVELESILTAFDPINTMRDKSPGIYERLVKALMLLSHSSSEFSLLKESLVTCKEMDMLLNQEYEQLMQIKELLLNHVEFLQKEVLNLSNFYDSKKET